MVTSAPLANQLIINWDPMCLNIEERAKVLDDLRRAIHLYESAQEQTNEQASRAMDTSPAELAEFVPAKTKNKRKRKRTRPPSESSSSDDNDNLISASSSEEEAEAESKERPPPPIRILRKEMWAKINSGLQKADIPIRFAKNTTEAVLVYPQTVSGFRAITSMLDKSKIAYTTNQLRQDKDLEVVIRGVNETLSDDILLEELQNKIPATKSVFRMKKGEKIWPLLVVHLDPSAPSAKTIFDLKSLSGLSVKVEPRRKNSTIPQCLRCLKFSHTANYCHAPWVCAFCARNHATAACTRKNIKDAAPSCSNCKGAHRATYRGCPKAPQTKTKSPKGIRKVASKPPPPPKTRPPTSSSPPIQGAAKRSYANVAASSSRPTQGAARRTYANVAASSSPSTSTPNIQNPDIVPQLQQLFREFISTLSLTINTALTQRAN